MTRRIKSLVGTAVWLFATLSSLVARADGVGTWLEIHRAAGSDICPDVERVFGAIQRLFPERHIRRCMDPSLASASAVVRIRPTTLGHEALLRVLLPREGERLIQDHDRNCDGLANALAVALIMLVEPETLAPPVAAVESPDPGHQQPASSAPTQTKKKAEAISSSAADLERSVRPIPIGPTKRRRVRLSAAAAANGGIGLLARPSAGFGVGLALSLEKGFGFALDGLRQWALPAERAPGSVRLDLVALLAGPCYRQRFAKITTINGCLILGAGSLQAGSFNYVRTESVSRPWVALGSRIDLHVPILPWLAGSTSLAAFGHLKPQSFSVDGVGVVADAPRAGVLVSLGLGIEDDLL